MYCFIFNSKICWKIDIYLLKYVKVKQINNKYLLYYFNFQFCNVYSFNKILINL